MQFIVVSYFYSFEFYFDKGIYDSSHASSKFLVSLVFSKFRYRVPPAVHWALLLQVSNIVFMFFFIIIYYYFVVVLLFEIRNS